MGLTIHDDLEQGTPEWLAARRGIVTASVVGKLITPTLRVADNDVSRGLTATLVAERISGFTEDTYTNNDMWRGVVSEPIARDHYSSNYEAVTEVGLMVLEEDGWTLGYSPDGLVGDDGLLEIKAPRTKAHVTTVLADEVPALYVPQLQAGLLVSGRSWIDYVPFVGGLPLWRKRVYPDPQWFEAIKAACIQFETTAAEMVAAYQEATNGLPVTERAPDTYEVELKLS